MPDYVLNRTYTYRSTHGHIINFVKGQPTWVPPICERDVVMFGAEPCEGDKIDVLEDLPAPVEQLSAEDRVQALFRAFQLMESRNSRGDYTGQGRPAPKVLKELTGFEVEVRERDAVWERWLDNKATPA